VFADALRAPSPAASSCDLVLTIDDGGSQRWPAITAGTLH